MNNIKRKDSNNFYIYKLLNSNFNSFGKRNKRSAFDREVVANNTCLYIIYILAQFAICT